jgi:hypothetical protein
MNKYSDNIVLPKDFSTQRWLNYFESSSKHYIEEHRKIPKYDDEFFSEVQSLGTLDFEDSTICGIFMIKVKQGLSERSSRKKQFTKATELINQERLQAGICIFYDTSHSFRLSLIYPIYKGTKRKFSNFRRHSFYVNEDLSNKTYILQLDKYRMDSMAELKDAFSVEKVSELFYKEFTNENDKLKKGIRDENDRIPADDLCGNFALLFAIRIIFLGFVQKKGWLGDNPNFIQDFIKVYDPNVNQDGIYKDLLKPLFFKALNSAPSQKNEFGFPHIPEPYNSHLVTAPYLNGGLFRPHEDYDTEALFITDEAIVNFVTFLFSFNFTLEENTLYDEELELNPEFLGIIFEKLINKAHGAIYTPRLEVDFMCRLSLVKYLQQNCLASISLENLYMLFFPEYGDESEQTVGDFTEDEAKDLLDKLENVTVCDPAIGSGAFAVGMLNVIDEIECSIYEHFLPDKPPSSPYERKKRIIFQSLYGVEVKQWAVWITQLRLWITLLIEAEDSFKHSEKPLLPSFDFKIRQGDSLIQMMGSSLFPVSGEGIIAADIKRKISDLVKLKTAYFYNKCPQQLHEIELKHKALYTSILEKRKKDMVLKLSRMKGDAKKEVQASLFETDIQTEIEFASKQQKRQIEELEFQTHQVDHEISQISNKNLPFIWRIDFPEIFIEKGGFDLVIGNPPYVSQEEIEDPLGKIKENTRYKELLRQMVNQDFSQDIPVNVINGKSDLYTFFYIRGLRLLNENGILTYICSNSWLDVEFGAWLQKFLLDRCNIHFIIDNLGKRVFRNAGINTIISVIGAWQRTVRDDDLIRFAAFKLPFENSLYTENLLAIEGTDKRIEYDDLRVNVVARDTLSKEGWENSSAKKYKGSKWGGIYLKAPNIYFTIMEKAKDKLVKLGDIADVKFGIKTGADEFFYIPKSNPHNIEKEFLKPVIKSPRECKSILINPDELGLWLFVCPHEKHELKGTNALKYIEMGESAKKYIKQGKDQGKYIVGIQNVSTIKNRNPWWSIKQDLMASIFIQMTFSETFKFFFSHEPIFGDNRLYCISSEWKNLEYLLNSSLSFLMIELLGRSNLGEGALDMKVYEAESILVPKPELFTSFDFSRFNDFLKRPIKSIFHELQVDPESDSFMNANPLPDRKALDEVVFRALGLTDQEIKALYAGLLGLTANRLSKANTFK